MLCYVMLCYINPANNVYVNKYTVKIVLLDIMIT